MESMNLAIEPCPVSTEVALPSSRTGMLCGVPLASLVAVQHALNSHVCKR